MIEYLGFLENQIQSFEVKSKTNPPLYLTEILEPSNVEFSVEQLQRAIYNILEAEFSQLHIQRCHQQPAFCIDEVQQKKLIQLIDWILTRLTDGPVHDEKGPAILFIMLSVVDFIDLDKRFWECYSNSHPLYEEVERFLENYVKRFRLDLAETSETAIWDKELLQQFKKAVSDKNWSFVEEHWSSFEAWLFSDVYFSQSVRALYCSAFDKLRIALAAKTDLLPLMQLPQILSAPKAFKVALHTANAHCLFGVVFGYATQTPKTYRGSKEESDSLAPLFQMAAQDMVEFTKWMYVFNRYPVRYPCLQNALGQFLSTADGACIEAYVDSISLSTQYLPAYYDRGRTYVAECLETFKEHADLEQRKRLWIKAFEKWRDWNFQNGQQDQFLSEISGCELDYALIGHFLEYVPVKDMHSRLDAIEEELKCLGLIWHESASALITARNLLLSEYQVMAHTQRVRDKQAGWLLSESYYLPKSDVLNRSGIVGGRLVWECHEDCVTG